MLTKIVFYLFIIISYQSFAVDYVGLDKPTQHVIKKTTENSELSCWSYKSFVVIQKQMQEMGAASIKIQKPDSKNMSCAEINSEKGEGLSEFYGHFVGSFHNFLLVDEPDSFGSQLNFQIYSLDGKSILKESRDISKPFKVIKSKKPAITYYKTLDVKCLLAKEGESCWAQIMASNKIPASLNLKAPDCKAAFANAHSELDNSVIVSAEVRIDNLRFPKVRFLKNKVYCYPSP